MSAESFDTFQQHLGHPELSREELEHNYLMMQVELLQEELKREPTDGEFMDWVQEFAADFGVVATENPELVLDYKNGGKEGRAALLKMKELLDEKHGVLV